MNFILLHDVGGKAIYINANNIITMQTNENGFTQLFMGHSWWVTVRESVEAIFSSAEVKS